VRGIQPTAEQAEMAGIQNWGPFNEPPRQSSPFPSKVTRSGNRSLSQSKTVEMVLGEIEPSFPGLLILQCRAQHVLHTGVYAVLEDGGRGGGPISYLWWNGGRGQFNRKSLSTLSKLLPICGRVARNQPQVYGKPKDTSPNRCVHMYY
jgi:hypothetical protein